MIRKSFSNLKLFVALDSFFLADTKTKLAFTSKLSRKILREFQIAYGNDLVNLNPYHFITAFQKYSDCGWLLADTYNAFVLSFGKKFDEFSYQ